MKMFKKVILGAAMALAFSGAQASAVTVGGITWDPDSALDFLANYNFTQWFSGTELVGLGEVTNINGVGYGVGGPNSTSGGAAGSFAPDRELTFHFFGFNQQVVGNQLGFTLGNMNLYSDNQNDYLALSSTASDRTNIAAATNTDLASPWLQLKATNVSFSGSTYNAGVLTIDWEIIGGLAADHFAPQPGLDPNTGVTSLTGTYSTASTFFVTAGPNAGISAFGASGEIHSNSIPEPASLALVGLGLIGVGALRRRKGAK